MPMSEALLNAANKVDKFDEAWVERIRLLDDYRIGTGMDSSINPWRLICDVADEIEGLPSARQSQLYEFPERQLDRAIVIFEHYVGQLERVRSQLEKHFCVDEN